MRKHYYVLGSTFGLLLVPVVAVSLTVPEYSWLAPLLEEWNYVVPIALGYLATLLTARAADHFCPTFYPSLTKTLFILPGTFLSGVFVGCTANLVTNGNIPPPFGWVNEFFDWFVKPAYWLTLFGLPCAIAVGLIYFAAWKIWLRVRES